MTTVRELLEPGYPEFAVKALKEHGGQTPLCCFTTQGSLVTCSWLVKLYPMKEFKALCLKCQREMQEKLEAWNVAGPNPAASIKPQKRLKRRGEFEWRFWVETPSF